MTNNEILSRLLTPKAHITLSRLSTGCVAAAMAHENAPNRLLAVGVGDDLNEALESLEKRISGQRRGPHVGGE